MIPRIVAIVVLVALVCAPLLVSNGVAWADDDEVGALQPCHDVIVADANLDPPAPPRPVTLSPAPDERLHRTAPDRDRLDRPPR